MLCENEHSGKAIYNKGYETEKLFTLPLISVCLRGQPVEEEGLLKKLCDLKLIDRELVRRPPEEHEVTLQGVRL